MTPQSVEQKIKCHFAEMAESQILPPRFQQKLQIGLALFQRRSQRSIVSSQHALHSGVLGNQVMNLIRSGLILLQLLFFRRCF